MPAWLVASSIWIVFLAAAFIRLRRERAQWREAETEVGPVLVASDSGPAVVGVLHPRIVVPEWALAIDGRARSLLLRHELEHLRAGDSRLLFAVAVLRALVPWNAALWWMATRIRLAIEIDCDARVIRSAGDARAYGLVLLAVGERHAVDLPVAAGLSEPGTSLEARINAMTSARPRNRIAASAPLAAVAFAALVSAAWTPQPRPLARAKAAPTPVVATQEKPTPAIAAPVVATPKPRGSRTPAPVVELATATPVQSVVVPEPQARQPRPLPGNPTPRYPRAMIDSAIQGRVVAAFSTDARGIPDTASIRIIATTHEPFAAEVRRVLPLWRFDSAGSVRLAFQFIPAGGDKPAI
ncbi:MAG: M56 family metallopeptidase, partial [Solirubrobacteraceae bacterium]